MLKESSNLKKNNIWNIPISTDNRVSMTSEKRTSNYSTIIAGTNLYYFQYYANNVE